MNEEEVRRYLDGYSDEFLEWMNGQTIGINSDGSLDYYDYDVKRFWDSKWSKVKLR
jgi:hypothetical protein